MSQLTNEDPGRRDFLKATGIAALTANLFTGRVQGANDRVSIAFIGTGRMGMTNLSYAMEVPGFQPVAMCDVYQPNLDQAVEAAKKRGFQTKAVKDFRDIMADKSIDVVCISTPDHWHAYMAIAGCKAGKDVYVEKPASVYVEEGQAMVAAARKYKRVVQAGSMQRSGGYFKKAAEIVKSGVLGEVTFCNAWQTGASRQEGQGNPPDSDPPKNLDWDLWLGPAPKVPFNSNRFGVAPNRWSTFRNFWDYAGGAMTDWGIHLIDPLHQCFDEVMPTAVTGIGGKFYIKDNVETPDAMMATFHYPRFVVSHEYRPCSPLPPMRGGNNVTAIHGTEATLIVSRSGCWVLPTGPNSKAAAVTFEENKEMAEMNLPHWQNFFACIKSREKPMSDIETCVRSTTPCLLANLSMRYKTRLDWDEKNWTVLQANARQYLKARYRKPWTLEV